MKMMKRWIAALALSLLLPVMAQAAADPFFGTWRLDKTKSTIGRDPGVKMKEFIFAPAGDGVDITETIEMMTGNGEKQVSHLAYAYGKAIPQTGAGFETLLVTKTGPKSVVWTAQTKGKTLAELQVAISDDGKEMAFRYVSSAADPTGEVTKDRYVYVKQ